MFLFFHCCCCCEIFLKWIAIEIALVKKAACAACIIKWTVCKLVFLRLSSSVLLRVYHSQEIVQQLFMFELSCIYEFFNFSEVCCQPIRCNRLVFFLKIFQFSVRRHVLICIGGAIFIALYIYYRSWLFQNVSSVWVTHITHAYT